MRGMSPTWTLASAPRLASLCAALVLSGCLWADEPAPVTGQGLATGAAGVASFALADDDPATGEVRVAPRGLTSSLNSWGQGARFHVTMQIENRMAVPVRMDPYQARVRDLGNVEIRLLELRVGDEAPEVVEIPPGETRVVDLFFGGTILRGPKRWDRFKFNWTFQVGERQVDGVAVFDQVADAEGPDPGPWEWNPGADPGHAPIRTPRWEHGRDAGS